MLAEHNAFFQELINIYFAELRRWLTSERAKIVGTPRSTRGYKKILANKKLRKRSGRWSRKVTGLFKGYIPRVKRLGDLSLTMGILGRGAKHQLRRAMELLQTGGAISNRKYMPVPVYKNLARIGYTGPWAKGDVHTGLKSKAFSVFNQVQFAEEGKRLVGIKSGGKMLYFDTRERKKRGEGFLKRGLMFIGLHGVRVKRQFSGRYDLYARFDRMLPAAIKRGQTAVDRATAKVQRKMK